jgi:DNA-binding CsgD family transcriptional regulator
MANSGAGERAEREVIRLCQAGLDARTFAVEALRRLRAAIPVDAFFWATADPATLLFTGSVVEEIPERVTPLFLNNEFLQDDVNKFVQLARRRDPVDSLYRATAGEPERSLRYRDILAPVGLGDELRAALVDSGSCWGCLCLHRERGGPEFTPDEAALLRRLTPPLARGLRTTLLLADAKDALGPDEPGMLILADDLSVVAMTPAAERWLAEIQDWPPRNELPHAIPTLARRLRALERDGDVSTTVPPRVRIRARSGRWLTLHGSRLRGAAAENLDQTAILIEPARPSQTAPLVLQAYGLTERESQVAHLVLGGLSTDEIAARLCISVLTVQQHLKAVFDKAAVRSRRELVARVFAEHYWPRILDGTRPTADGSFAVGTPPAQPPDPPP